MIKSVILLLCVCKLTIEVKVIKCGGTDQLKCLLFSCATKTHLINCSLTHKLPRRQSLIFWLVKQPIHTIDKKRYVKKLYVPTSHNINIKFFPERKKLLQHVNFIRASYIRHIFVTWCIFTTTKRIEFSFDFYGN